MRHIAHHPIRTRGTFCGSLAHADPASEWCLVAATLDAEIVLRSARGTRTIAAADFFDGIMTTARAEDELLTEVRLPILPADTRFGFCEFSRRAGDFALGMALRDLSARGRRHRRSRASASAAPRRMPRRIAEAEAALDGRKPGAEVFAAAADAAAAAIDPLEDINTNAEYRRDLVRAMTRRALERAAA